MRRSFLFRRGASNPHPNDAVYRDTCYDMIEVAHCRKHTLTEKQSIPFVCVLLQHR